MATKIGTLYAAIRGDERPLKRSLKDAEKSAVKGAKRINGALSKISFKHVIGGFAAFAAATGLARITRATIRLADTQERAEKKLESVLRSTGQAAGFNANQLKEMAKAMQDVTTVGDEVIINAQAQLLTFKQIRGEAYRRTLMAALDLSEVMDQDLRSSIVMVGKALNDPIANMGALGRAGIQFTKDQKETIKTLWEMGRTAEAQRLILEELESQFGGAAKAARDTFGGELDALKNTLGDIGEEIGFAIMPKLNEMVTGFHSWIQENDQLLQQDLPQYLGDVATNMGNIAQAIGNIAKFAGLRSVSRTAEEASRLAEKGLLDIQKFTFAESHFARQRMVDEARIRELRGKGAKDFDAVNAAIQDGIDRTRVLEVTTREVVNKYEHLDNVIASVFAELDKSAAKVNDIAAENIWESLQPKGGATITGGDNIDAIAKNPMMMFDLLDQRLAESQQRWSEYEDTATSAISGLDEVATDPGAMFDILDQRLAESQQRWQEHTDRITEIVRNAATAMEGAFSDIFFDTLTGELKSLEDYATSIFESMARVAADTLSQMLVQSALGGLGGAFPIFAGAFHKGGIVGASAVPVRMVNSNMFANAPRFHNGLKPDEFPAILQKGEEVIPAKQKKGMADKVNYNITVMAPEGRITKESQSQLQSILFRTMQRSAGRNL